MESIKAMRLLLLLLISLHASANAALQTPNLPAANQESQKPAIVDRIPANFKNLTHHQTARSQATRASANLRSPATAAATNLLAVRQQWKQMEKSLGLSLVQMADQLKLQLRELLSPANSSTSQPVSSGCKWALNELADKVRDGSLWASQMLDASAKLPSGLLDGTLTELGNFDGCLALRSSPQIPSIQGQYCTISIKPHLISRPRLHTACQKLPALSSVDSQPKNSSLSLFRWLSQNSHQFYYAGLRMGVCVPHKCSRNDLQLLLSGFVGKFDLVGQVKSCHVAAAPINGDMSTLDQFTRQLDTSQIIIIFILLTVVGLSLVGTSLDCLFSQAAKPDPVPHRHEQVRKPKRWQYQVYQRPDSLAGCNECTHSVLANNLALWRSGISQLRDKEDPLLSCPTAATATTQVELDYDRCADEEDETRDESWIVQLEQNQLQQQASLSSIGEADLTRQERSVLVPPPSPPIALRLLGCFSLKRNLKTIGKQVPTVAAAADLRQQQQQLCMDDIKVIHGLRTLTMIWIVFGHTIGLVNPEMMNNLFALAQLSCSSRFLQVLLNATLAVNTFFMISGVVTMISLLRRCGSAATLLILDSTDKPPIRQTQRHQVNSNHHHHNRPRHLAASLVSEDSTQIDDCAGCAEDSTSIASSSLSSGVSSGRRCIHRNHQNHLRQSSSLHRDDKLRRKPKQESTPTSPLAGGFCLPPDFKPFLWLLMRYLRLTPAYATVIGLSVLMPALGDGPFWLETAGQLGATCKQHWHLNLMYVNNLLETDKLCLIHSWYLSNDWQFFLLTLALLGLAYQCKKLALLLAVTLALASMATTFAVTAVNEFPPTIVTTSPAVAERWQFIHQLYYKPWPHLNSYLVGLLVGYLILRRQQQNKLKGPAKTTLATTTTTTENDKLNSWRPVFIGLLVALLAGLILSSIYPWNMGYRVDPLLTGLHAATFRTLWASCCGWLVFTLAGSPRNWLAKFLAWPGFQLTSRLTYCTYLVHPLVIYYHFGTLRERIDSSMYAQLSRFVATLGLSYLGALVLSLLVESPSIQLQHLLASLSSGSAKPAGASSHGLSSNRGGGGRGRTRNPESSSSGGNESAATSDSWLVDTPAHQQRPHRSADASCQSLPPVEQLHPAKQALDADFQRKLAQAIGRGFRIRSRIANAASSCIDGANSSSSSSHRPPHQQTSSNKAQPTAVKVLHAESTCVGPIQNPLQKLHPTSSLNHPASVNHQQSAAIVKPPPPPPPVSRRLQQSQDACLSLATFSAAPACQPLPAAIGRPAMAERRSSTDGTAKQSGGDNNCSLNDLIQMRRKFLSQRSHSNCNN